MIARWRIFSGIGLLGFLATVVGCSDTFLAGPIVYDEQETMTKDIAGKANLAGKPLIQGKVHAALSRTFGESPQHINVPAGAPLTGGEIGRLGVRLGNYLKTQDGRQRIKTPGPDGGPPVDQVGGYGLYRKNCLHCHGVSGAGNGPTAPFLYPIPRDYRRGLYKFTSTPNGARPDRDDLRRTIRNGLHGTSMPAFEALMSADEIEQVIDYVTFLSLRGETELALIEEGFIAEEEDADAISDDIVDEIVQGVFKKWDAARDSVVNPPVARTPSSRESILRGRELFLGNTKEKLECAGCHGAHGRGDGPSFVSQDVFNRIVFGGDPSEHEKRVQELDEKTQELWKQKLDEWGNPLRPANLNRGPSTVYKGGRRPLDIYWRIAKGITGAQMPAHYPTINHEQIWDLVNFVLALPYQPELLEDGVPPGPAADAAVAHR